LGDWCTYNWSDRSAVAWLGCFSRSLYLLFVWSSVELWSKSVIITGPNNSIAPHIQNYTQALNIVHLQGVRSNKLHEFSCSEWNIAYSNFFVMCSDINREYFFYFLKSLYRPMHKPYTYGTITLDMNLNTPLLHWWPRRQQQKSPSGVVEWRCVRVVYGKYSVNRSSYRPLVRVTEAFVPTTRASVRTTACSRVSKDELFAGHPSCTHAVTTTKPMPISSTSRRVNVYSLPAEHRATCKRRPALA